jgi:electron transfer flavoprotein alpha subunit
VVAVLIEPNRARLARELLGTAARLASEIDGRVVALGPALPDIEELGEWGADEVQILASAWVEEDVAAAVTTWASAVTPWAMLAPSTAWGREVASRVAASLGAGLTGDAVGLAVVDGRLTAWKPAFGGRLVVAITASSPVQIATVRGGILPLLAERYSPMPETVQHNITPLGRVVVHARTREDNADDLANAEMVLGVGMGVDPGRYGELQPLLDLLGGQIAATRKVTDKGWLPRARQVGITGHTIAPRLFVSVGASGKFNHTVGVRSSGTILAVNPDPDALIFDWADVGIVGDWSEVIPELTSQLQAAMARR